MKDDAVVLMEERWLAAGLVLFRPNPSAFETIERLAEVETTIFIQCNCPESLAIMQAISATHGNVVVLGNGENIGLSQAINGLLREAKAYNFEALIFLDQDTNISRELWRWCFSVKWKAFMRLRNIALCQLANNHSSPQGVQRFTFESRRFLINSGSIFRLDLVDKVFVNNRRFFVECVDYLNCVAARRHGYATGVVYGPCLVDHRSGQEGGFIQLGGYHIHYRVYPSKRILEYLRASLRLIADCLLRLEVTNVLYLSRFLTGFLIRNLLSVILRFKEENVRA